MTPAEYIAESARRRAALESPYNPVTGEGSLVERTHVLWEPGTEHRLPVTMLADATGPIIQAAQSAGVSIRELVEQSGTAWDAFVDEFLAIRFRHDFELWCAVRAAIKDKKGQIVPFVLNRPQRLYVARLEAMRMRGDPVAMLVLKHRQWGCTTLSYTYIAWHQIELYTGRDAWFVGLDKAGAEDVRQRYDTIRERTGITIKNHDQQGTTKLLIERNALISIGTVERPNAPSGRPAHYVHLFEVGKWPSNPTVSAEKVAQNLGAMHTGEPGTVKIIESTAQASTGTYFMDICRKAQNGEISDDFLFVSWLDDPQYQRHMPKDVDRWLETWSEYDRFLWERGATLEQIAWYRHKLTQPEYSDAWRLKEEFPTTADEAFQTGGRRVFPAQHVQIQRRTCREPLLIGNLRSDATRGREAFQNIRFEPDPRGIIAIWKLPGDLYGGQLKKGCRYTNRFAAASDVGGRWEGADWSVTGILDRAPRFWNSVPEIVAELRCHLDKDLFAWESAKLAYWYDKAFWAIEVNSLQEDNETDYEAGQTVLDTIMPFYPNLYLRTVVDRISQETTDKPGFMTNKQTKGLIIDSLSRYLREHFEAVDKGTESNDGYIERCYAACDEMDLYLLHEDGSMGATSKSERSSKTKKDDRVITRALLMYLDSKMDPVREIMPPDPRLEKYRKEHRRPSMATFN